MLSNVRLRTKTLTPFAAHTIAEAIGRNAWKWRNGGRIASTNAGNVLTGGILDTLPLPEPGFTGARIVYGEGCTVPDDRLSRLGVTFKQVSYQIEGL